MSTVNDQRKLPHIMLVVAIVSGTILSGTILGSVPAMFISPPGDLGVGGTGGRATLARRRR